MCNKQALGLFLEGHSTDYFIGSSYHGELLVDAERKEQFTDLLEEFVNTCNAERECPEGYELVHDVDNTCRYVFYVMREDGEAMVELPVIFLQKVISQKSGGLPNEDC